MIPSFGRIFGEPIPAYFALLMVGFVLATFIAARWCKRVGLDHDVMIDLGLVSVLAGVAGGRILHVVADGYFWDYVHLCTDPSLDVWRTVETARECGELGGAWDTAKHLCHARERSCLAWAEFWNGGRDPDRAVLRPARLLLRRLLLRLGDRPPVRPGLSGLFGGEREALPRRAARKQGAGLTARAPDPAL